MSKYALNCGLLLIPVLLWNLILAPKLPPALQPAAFDQEIPVLLLAVEQFLRLLVVLLPFAMPLELAGAVQRAGLLVFVLGTLVYMASWLPLVSAPASGWSSSRVGFLAPACTPALWLLGIALMGQRLWMFDAYRWWYYLVPSVLFLAAHIAHADLVYRRVHAAGS